MAVSSRRFAVSRTPAGAGGAESHFAASKLSVWSGVTAVAGVAEATKMPALVSTVTGPSQETISYAYDLANGNRPLAQTDGLGNVTKFGYDVGGYTNVVFDPNGVWTQTLQDARGNTKQLISCQDQSASRCSSVYYTYYPDATTTTLTPDPRNDVLLTMRDGRSASATDNSFLTTYGYDAAGNRTTVTDPLGRVTTTGYTAATTPAVDGGVTPAGLPATLTTPGGLTQKVEYYSTGDVARVRDPQGKVTTYSYDGLGRLLRQAEVSGTYPDGLVTSYGHDVMGRKVSQTDPATTNRVTGAVHTPVTRTTYDVDGRPLSETVSDATGGDAPRTESWAYNTRGQQVSETDEVGNVTRYGYDAYGRIVLETSPDGGRTRSTYDVEDRLLTTTMLGWTGDPNAPSDPTDLVLSAQTYDPAGRLASATDAMGYVTGYTYTDNGLESTITRKDPATGESFVVDATTYDAAGNVLTSSERNGTSLTRRTVDAAGRVVTSVDDPDGAARQTAYTYDRDDRVVREVDSGPSVVLQRTDTLFHPSGEPLAEVTHQGSPATNPVGRWLFDETAGTSAADAAGNSPGTATGSPTWVDDETRGRVVQLDRSASFATTGPLVDTDRSFTVSAWVKATDAAATSTVLSQDGGGAVSGFSVQLRTSKRWAFSLPSADDPAAPVTSVEAAATVGAWTHLAAVYDSAAGTATLYVNGQSAGSTAAALPKWSAKGAFAIGRSAAATGWLGQLDDVQAYQAALTAAQVSAVYAGTAPASGAGVVRTSYTRDEDGLETSETDPNGVTTLTEYDEGGQPAVVVEPPTTTETGGGTGVLARSVTTTGYDTFGAVTEIKDATGNVSVNGTTRPAGWCRRGRRPTGRRGRTLRSPRSRRRRTTPSGSWSRRPTRWGTPPGSATTSSATRCARWRPTVGWAPRRTTGWAGCCRRPTRPGRPRRRRTTT